MKKITLRMLILCACLVSSVLSLYAQSNTEMLFTPGNKSNWYTYYQKTGKNNDSLRVFQFEDQTLHVSGQEFAYICTEKTYGGNFRLSLEFKWGERKYPPRENAKRDAGVLYFCQTIVSDKIWPLSLEFQIQEGDCGDFWMTGGSQIYHNDTLTPPAQGHRAIKFKDAEKPSGQWNLCEIIVRNGSITHKINGEVVNIGERPSLTRGRILLQSEGAEIFYRNVKFEQN
jgi:hypothetical protein